ncbi:MAG: PAS domain S-box protein [Desulfobacula sp.]|jgi:PAS domain S-box-containing protein|uniref:sensor histidine kinase n=1 Tax=Desulfobacula sp. TaxID=2593537 RepID=UPI001DFBB835|nr:PAS domain S-box protein [Desulfobacula sp.]MBT6338383.1 PAS domain S-box protein [Desulfobacula sp.]MBT6751381.1 PAS domain S-box protein [Desulfobacula sp.]
MSLTHKLIFGYITIALMMCGAGYLTITSFNKLKNKIVQLEADSIEIFKSSYKIVHALETSEESIKALIDNQPKIIYTFSQISDTNQELENKDQIKKKLITDLNKVESSLSSLIGTEFYRIQKDGKPQFNNSEQTILTGRHNVEKKHFYYYLKYLSHFIHLVENIPENAPRFFKKTLEPHYKLNIYPIIEQYRKNKQKENAQRVKKIIIEYLPNVGVIIIFSTILILLSTLLLGGWVSSYVFKPINDLTAAAKNVGKGNFETRIKIKSKDEIGVLTDVFNNMIKDLRESTVSKTYMDNIVKSMLDTLIVANPDFTIRKVNQSATDMLGYSRDELLGQSIENIILPENTDTSIIDLFVHKGSIANVEMIYLTKDGIKIPVLFSGSTFFNNNSQVDGIVCVAQDIADLKRTQANLKKAYDEMEQKVERRTGELSITNKFLKKEIKEHIITERALKNSERKLRRLSSRVLTTQEKVRRQLSCELHDDLGQSLSLLKVKLSFLQTKEGCENKFNDETLTDIQEYIDFIIEDVRRLSRDLSPSILEDLGLTAALKWMLNEFSDHYPTKYSLNIDNIDACFVSENQIMVYRIFQEFLTNVGKHANADAISVSIQKKKNEIIFIMEDNGVGFDLTELSSRQSTQKGIGLAAMQERALMLGSYLNIIAQKGKGTRISFIIRREKSENLSNIAC